MGFVGNIALKGKYIDQEEVSDVIVRALRARLNDSNKLVLAAVIETLICIQDPQSTLPLCKTLKDRSWTIREEAPRALKRLHDERALFPLLRALNDTGGVQMPAADAVAGIGEPALVPLMEALQADAVQMRSGTDCAFGYNDPTQNPLGGLPPPSGFPTAPPIAHVQGAT